MYELQTWRFYSKPDASRFWGTLEHILHKCSIKNNNSFKASPISCPPIPGSVMMDLTAARNGPHSRMSQSTSPSTFSLSSQSSRMCEELVGNRVHFTNRGPRPRKVGLPTRTDRRRGSWARAAPGAPGSWTRQPHLHIALSASW